MYDTIERLKKEKVELENEKELTAVEKYTNIKPIIEKLSIIIIIDLGKIILEPKKIQECLYMSI